MFLCLICAFTAANLNAQAIHAVSTETELRDAITAATAGDIIDITADITLTAVGPNINKNLSIKGNDHTIDGDASFLIFSITSIAEVEIENLNLVNGSGVTGGAVSIAGKLTASNCTFENNSATNGGAVVISIASATFIASNCTFENNTATGYGGAVFMSLAGIFEATECTFKDNTADRGGAVYMTSSSSAGTFEATECTFDGNTANMGGAVNMQNSSTFEATECTFKNNYTTGSNAPGGVVFMGGDALFLATECIFESNTAATNGGAVYILEDASFSAVECTFEGNNAANGGAVHNNNSTSVFEAAECTFIDNTANSGGAVYSIGYFSATECTFKDNTATNTLGGAVSVTSSGEFIAFGCIFDGNSANSYGGAVCVNGVPAMASNCTFKNNSGSYGGAVFLFASGSIFITLNSTFYGNSADYSGGAVNLTENPVYFTALNSTFYNNTANTGGAINVGSIGYAYLFHSTIVGNKATTSGGGVRQTMGGTYHTYNCLYVGNEVNSLISAAAQVSSSGAPASGVLSSNNLVENAPTITLATIFGTNTLLPEGYIVPLFRAKGASMISGASLFMSFPIPGFNTEADLLLRLSIDQTGTTRAEASTCYPYVTYGSVENADVPTYNLTVNVGAGGGGTAIIGTTGTTTTESGIACGTSRTITAIPNDCYEFVNWTRPNGGVFSGSTDATFSISRDSVLTANFTPNTTPYTLVLSATGSGTVVASPAKATYSCGDVVELTATPSPDHRFVGWDDGGGIVSSSNPHNITIGGTSAAISWVGVFEPLNKKMRIKRVNVKKGRLIISPQP